MKIEETGFVLELPIRKEAITDDFRRILGEYCGIVLCSGGVKKVRDEVIHITSLGFDSEESATSYTYEVFYPAMAAAIIR